MQGRIEPFGKRNQSLSSSAARVAPARLAAEAEPHRAFFAEVRAEIGPSDTAGAIEVPRTRRKAS